MYTVFWDGYDGIPGDRSFNTREEADEAFDRMHVAYKRLQKETPDGGVTLEVWKDEEYWKGIDE